MNPIRYAFRSLVKSPGHTLVALLTLALGIGVNTSMFSVVNALLFRTAPYPNVENLLVLQGELRHGEKRNFSAQEIQEIRPAADGFETLVTAGYLIQSISEPGRPAERVFGIGFTKEMMEVFRVQPALGRSFTESEYEQGKNQVILISDRFWKTRFAGDRGVLGKTIRLDGETVTIVGVMPASFDYPMYWGSAVFWRPLNFTNDQMTYRAYRSFSLLGRLKPGVTAESAQAQLVSVAADQEKRFPQEYAGFRYIAVPMHVATMDSVGRAVSWMLLGLSGFVLLIACANLANLQLARATAYMREFAIRAALGASRGRLIVQQLTECVVLSVTGGLLGMVIALWINGMIERSITIAGTGSLFQAPIETKIFLLSMAVSLLTGIVFGIVPALVVSRTDVNSALKSQSRGSTTGRGHHRMRQMLIIGEVALALVLLGGAAIMNRGFSQLLNKQVGWDTNRVLMGQVPIPEERFNTAEKRIDFYRRLETRLAALPGVEAVGLSTSLPLFNYSSERQVFVDAPAQGGAQDPLAAHVMITPNYFKAMGIPILDGSTFSPEIKADSPQYILINQALAQKYWPGDSAIGKRLGVADNAGGSNVIVWREIIGVVGDVEPAANITNPNTRFAVYRPIVQEPWSFVSVVLRSPTPGALAESLRRAVYEIEPDLPTDQVGTIPQYVDRVQHNLMVVGDILTGFALLGLVLASIGIYGVISNLVAQRTTEFGIRLALGARPQDILSDVLRRGGGLTMIGLAIGLGGAYFLGRFLSSVMPRLAQTDTLGLIVVALILLAVALMACWIPARRATKVDPMVALRAE